MRFAASAGLLAAFAALGPRFGLGVEAPGLLTVDLNAYPDSVINANCQKCCPTTIRTVISKVYTTIFSEKTIYTTATEHDVSTKLQYTTQYVTKTALSTYKTSYPVTVTKTIDCEPSYNYGHSSNNDEISPGMQNLKGRTYGCKTTTVTSWATITATKTVTGIESIVTTKTVRLPTTIHDTRTIIGSTTIWVPTTYIETKTIVSEHPVTLTVDNTKYTTKSTTIYTTILSTVTTSYPVVSTVTQPLPGPTVTRPGQNVTQTLRGPTVTVPGQPSTITVPGETKTLPGSTVLTTITRTLPFSTVRVTQEQGTKTITQPASTVVETRTQTLAPTTIERPASTVTVTPITDVTLCPAPTGLTAPLDPKSNRTFGCNPGYICNPPKPRGCNLWREPPADDYLCDPKYCIPSLPYTNVTWKQCETSYYPPSYGYFNLNPEAFGLSYDIFEYKVIHKTVSGHVTTITTGNWDSQTSLTAWPKPSPTPSTSVLYARGNKNIDKFKGCKNKRSITPAVCFDTCSQAYMYAASVGKSDALCKDGSDFRKSYDSCARCISANSQNTTILDYVAPTFAQFLNFCSGTNTEKPPTSSQEPPEPIVTQQPSVGTSTQVDTSQPGFTPVQPSEGVTTSPTGSVSPTLGSSNTGDSSKSSDASSPPTSGSGSATSTTTASSGLTTSSGLATSSGLTTSSGQVTNPSSTNQATTSGSSSTSDGNGNTSGTGSSVSTTGSSPTTTTYNATMPVVTGAASHLSGLYYSAASLILSSIIVIMY